MTDYEYIGVVKDRLGSMPDIKTKPKETYKQAHTTAEFLCKRSMGDRGEVHVDIKEVKKK
jgi:hypothetical protein